MKVMFLFYVDESGTLDLDCSGEKEPLYVLTAVSLFEHRWHGFEKTINRHKRELMNAVFQRTGVRLELADCEAKSTWVRIPKQRERHPFLNRLTVPELTGLCELFYRQLKYHNMWIFCVVVDKRHLRDYMERHKLHQKAWELLLERIEEFMRRQGSRHQALVVCDDLSKKDNRSLAMKHAYLLEEGTSSGLWLTHICEMPLFVRSELSNGVQLADLVGYNLYRAFRREDPDYPFLIGSLPFLWPGREVAPEDPKGLFVFPGQSPLLSLRATLGNKRSQLVAELGYPRI
jgi:hypothetical protein